MGMKKLSPLYITMVIFVLCGLIHVSSTEPLHGLRMLQESKATPTSNVTTLVIQILWLTELRSCIICAFCPFFAQSSQRDVTYLFFLLVLISPNFVCSVYIVMHPCH